MIQLYKPSNTNHDYNGDHVLLPDSCVLEIELNGAWELTLTHPIDDESRYKSIVENAVIKAPSFNGEQFFRIYNKEITDTGVTANARPIFLDSADDVFLLDTRPTDKNGQAALNILLAGTKYTGQSNIQKVNTAYYIRKNLIEALNSDDEQSFLNRWGGEILYDNYKIYINDRIGENNGVSVEYGKNLTEIDETINLESVCTRIIPLAYNGYTLEGSTPWVDSPNINKYPKIYHRVVQFDDIKLTEDAQEDEISFKTLAELRAELRRRCQILYTNEKVDAPVITLNISMVLLQYTEEYKNYQMLETVSLGDVVKCVHNKYGIETEARVVGLVYDCVSDKIESVTLGQFQKNYFDGLSSLLNRVENAFNQNGTVNADWLNGTINALNVKFKALRDVAQKQSVRAILFEDLDPTSPTFGAMCLGTMGFEISNRRNATNTDWEWRTFGTGAGFTCDALIVGKILGSRFELDLDAGTIKFGVRDKNGNIVNPDLSYGPDGLKIRFENDYVTEGEMSSAISMSASGLKQEFSATVSGVLAGNNNMLTGTALKTEENVWYSSTDGSTALLRSITNPIATSGSVINVVMMNPGKGKIRFNKNRIALKAGKTYTISALMGTHMPSLSVTFGMTSSNGLKTVTIKERPAVYSHTFTPSVDDRDFTIFEIQMNDPLPSTGANGITFADIKLTESDQPTPWSPSAADLADELDAYSTTDEINSSIESRAAKLTKEFNTKLGGYPTTIEMNGAITTNAAGLTAQFNAKLTNYSSIMDMNSAIQLSASGLQANFNQKLTGYSNTTEMNTAIQASASGIMSVVSKKVNSSEVYTLIQQNAYAVKVAWNNNTKYVQLESAQFAIYDGTNRLISLGSSGMRLYRDDDGNPVGNIGTNKFKTDYSAKGLVFDLEPSGTYMGWAQRPNASADSFTLLLTYCRRALGDMSEGLSVGCDLDMRWFSLKNVSLQGANLEGKRIVKSHGGISSMGFVYYTNGTPQKYGYVEMATTDRGMIGVDAWQSDGRLKKNITPCADAAVAFIDQIPVRSFDWKADNSHEDYGLIAQELEALDENLVFKVAQRDDENNVLDEIYQIRPEKLIPPLIKSVQELKQLVDSQQQLINQLCENTGITTKMPPMARTLGIEPVTQYTDEIQIFKPETTKPETPKPIRYRVLDDATKEIEFIDESEETT